MINKIKSRKDFIKIQKNGSKVISAGVVLQYLNNSNQSNPSRFGFTASKKVGGAVQRNKAKRRMRSLVFDVIENFKTKGWDYVIIARKETVHRKYHKLKNDLIVVAVNSKGIEWAAIQIAKFHNGKTPILILTRLANYGLLTYN